MPRVRTRNAWTSAKVLQISGVCKYFKSEKNDRASLSTPIAEAAFISEACVEKRCFFSYTYNALFSYSVQPYTEKETHQVQKAKVCNGLLLGGQCVQKLNADTRR